MVKYKKRKESNVIRVILLLFILAVTVWVIKGSRKEEKMRLNACWSTGYVTKYFKYAQAGGGRLVYEFRVDGNIYEGRKGYGHLYKPEAESLINKPFPVIYDSMDVRSNAILIYKAETEDYRFNFPDSFKMYKFLDDSNKVINGQETLLFSLLSVER